MARPPLAIGTSGTIRVYGKLDGKWVAKDNIPSGAAVDGWRAMTLFRDRDGETRPVERSGTSRNKAVRALQEHLRDRADTAGGEQLTASSRLTHAATAWLAQVRGEVADTTFAGYERGVTNHIVPALGALRLRECKTSRLNTYFKQLRADGMSANYRRSLRYILYGIMNHAVLENALDHNPVKEMPKIRGGNTRTKHTFTVDELAAFLTALDADRHAQRADLPDFLRFLFGTGVRYGEALAVRWSDINLTDTEAVVAGQKIPPQSVWINGNLVEVKGQGVLRHPGKTPAANRVVGLPKFLSALLLVRRDVDARDGDPVFPTGMAGWRAPTNVQRAVRNFRDRAGYTGFTTHVSRRTVATLLDHAGQSARQIADQVGHAQPSMTQNVYMGRGQANPDAAAALDAAHRTN